MVPSVACDVIIGKDRNWTEMSKKLHVTLKEV